jgi:uncharacterized phiE125 gp8 family phage protein
MTYAPVQTVAPVSAPVTLAEVKADLRVEFSDNDTMIQGYLDAAVSHLDGWGGILGRCMVTQTWRQDYAEFGEVLRLPFVGASSVAVTYRNALEASVTLDAGEYVLLQDALGAYLAPGVGKFWPTLGLTQPAVSVTATYGYGNAAAVPAALKAAIMLHVGALYEGKGDLPAAFYALVAPHRRVGV